MKALFENQSVFVCQYWMIPFLFFVFVIILIGIEPIYSDEPIYSKTDLFLQEWDQDEQKNKDAARSVYKKRIDAFSYLSRETKELGYALASDDFRTADSLADKADLNAKTPDGDNFLYCCAHYGVSDIVYPRRIQWLINHGLNIEQMVDCGIHGSLQDDGSFKEMRIYETLIENNVSNPYAIFYLAEEHPDIVNQKNPATGRTPLGRAAYSGNNNSIEVLLAYNASIDLPDDKGNTPLIEAVIHQNYSTALLLVSYGANANIPVTVNEFNQATGNTDLVKYENVLDFLVRSTRSIEENKHYEEKVKNYGFLDRDIKFNAKKALITLLKKQERLKQLERPNDQE
ncbi:MAG: ankyrin repeat domain-containing protein [Planctomycetaceae bacterium]|jgi:ankyrin repeat protein|nr:ankyrin repeat domain-containing protein [Planctomycetaceae bacterium]